MFLFFHNNFKNYFIERKNVFQKNDAMELLMQTFELLML